MSLSLRPLSSQRSGRAGQGDGHGNHQRDDEGHVVFGYDISLGADLNFSNTIAVEGGVRYMKSFSLIQQLGDGSVKVSPEYLQIYLGIGVNFSWLEKLNKDD